MTDLELFAAVEKIVNDLGAEVNEWKVADLARYVHDKVPALRVASGYFLFVMCSHTWLVTPSGSVIDVKPKSLVGGPLLILFDLTSPWKGVYIERSERVVAPAERAKPLPKVANPETDEARDLRRKLADIEAEFKL